jgi:hypothetical protein
MKKHQFEPVTDPDAFRLAFEMLAIGNVAVKRAQAHNRVLNFSNYYSIGGRIISNCPEVKAVTGGASED